MDEDLRKKAEELLSRNPKERPTLSTVQVQKLFHELDVHQIELQMQNEELRTAQAELAHSRDAYAELYDFAPVGYLIVDFESRILDANFTAATLLGIERCKLLGKTFASFIHHDSLEAWDQHHRHNECQQAHGGEFVLHRPDGVSLSAQVDCAPRPDAGHCLVTVVDISQRVQAEDALRKSEQELEQRIKERTAELQTSEERFRAIFDHVPDGILLADPETRKFRMASQAFCTNMGYSEEQVLEMGLEGIHPAEDLPYVIGAFEKQARGEAEEVYDIPFLHSDGGVSYADMKAFRIHLDGKPYLLGHVRDISKQKRIEDALHQSEEKYRRLFETETDAIMIFDGETLGFIDVNNAAVELYGYSREEFLQLKQTDITDEPEISDASIRATLAGELTFIPMRRHRKKDGTVFPVEITVCTFLLKDRRVACEVIRDVTERVAREDALRKLTTELSLAEQRERERIAKELHDSVSQLLSSSYLRLSVLKESASLTESATEAVSTICDILHETLQQTRSLTFELSCPMLSELGLAAALEDLCSSMSNQQSICFEFQGSMEQLPLKMDRKIVLFRAARELLINVMKHSEATRACVKLDRVDGNVRICVEDDGKGFDAARAGKGFSPSGGFGLFNIREYLRHAGGELRIESIPDDGTEVVLTVPLEETDE